MPSHQSVRDRHIRIIQIKDALTRAELRGKNIIKEELINMCSAKWGVARRTAQEYIKSAAYSLGYVEKDKLYVKAEKTEADMMMENLVKDKDAGA